MEIKKSDGSNADFICLCYQLDQYLNNLVGGEENRSEYIQYNTLDDIHDVFVAYENDIAVGCASFKKYAHSIAEVKRVFVKHEYRGRQIAEQLMIELEKEACKQGYCYLVLETGEPLVAASQLYKKRGFRIIDNYGPYIDIPESVCMGKEI